MATAKTTTAAPRAQRAEAAAKKDMYLVLSPLSHVSSAELYQPGDEIELTAAEAEQLLGHTVELKAKA